ncbi:MAG TPA: hypothetical protein PKC49_03600 [Phycisphaerae bacterium]|nr:hypothetical protein [Phycisphaerae bacterium]
MAARRKKPVKTVTLKIPADLYRNLGRLIEGTGFRSVTEFAVHVLRDLAAGGKLRHETTGLTPQEVELVRKRLAALGYIDG